MTFELLESTPAELTSVTNRTETHGEDRVPAISFGLKITAANSIYDRLSQTLRHGIYMKPEGQADLPNVEDVTQLLRTPDIERVILPFKFEGWTVELDYGTYESEPIKMGACKLYDFRTEPKQGGTVELMFSVSTADLSRATAGLLWSKQKSTVWVKVLAPKIQEPAIDGTEGHQGLKKTKKRKGADDAQPDLVGDDKPLNTAGDGEEPEPGAEPASGAAAEPLLEAGVVSAMNSDGNREVLVQAEAEEPAKSATDQFIDRHAPATTH